MRLLLRKFGEFLIAASAQKAKPPREASPSRAVSPSAQFGKRAMDMIGRRAVPDAPLVAGSVQLLGLREIKRAVGPAWDSVAGRAYAVTERAIENHLSKADVCTLHDDETYVICFAALSKKEAQDKTNLIVEEAKAALLAEIPEASEIVLRQQVTTIPPSESAADGESLLGMIAASLESVRQEYDKLAQRQRRLLLEQAKVVFLPVWVPAKDGIVLYRCSLDDATGKTTLKNLQNMTDQEELQKAICDLDYVILGQGISALHTMLNSASKTVLIVPVHFQSVSWSTHRQAYLSLCQKIPKAYGKYVIFEIYGVPHGTAPARLAEIVQVVRQGSYSVILSVADQNAVAAATSGIANLYGISADLNSFASHALIDLSKQARAAGLRLFGCRAKTLGAINAAMNAGFDFVDGEAVATCIDTPKGAYRWRPTGLLDGPAAAVRKGSGG